jgi:hypothetical protein
MKSFASPRLYKAASLLVALSLVMPSYAGGNGFNPENNLRSSNNNTDIGVNISANALYALGYTGTRSIIANIEGGRTWDGHDVFHASATQFKTITDISDYANNPGVAAEAGWGGSLGDLDRHATWVGHSMAGFDPNNASPLNTRRGIAYGAELWSGGVATEFGPHAAGSYGGSFNWSTDKVFINPYLNALVNGVGGRKADIVNSSWGFTEPTGYNSTTIAGDAVAWQSKKIMVFSAGNSGQNSNGTDRPNSVGGIGAGAAPSLNALYLAGGRAPDMACRAAEPHDDLVLEHAGRMPGYEATAAILGIPSVVAGVPRVVRAAADAAPGSVTNDRVCDGVPGMPGGATET